MATISPVLMAHKKNKKGLSPIYLRIEAGGRTRYKSLRMHVRESHWNEKSGRVRKGYRHTEELNSIIADRVAAAEKEILQLTSEGKRIEAAELKQRISVKDQMLRTDFFAFATNVINQFERQSKLYTARRYRSICRKLEKFSGRPLPFYLITPAFLGEYETYLIEEHDNKPNTVASNFRCIRAILYRAIRDGYVDQGDNPFFRFRIKTSKPNRTKLSLEQIKAIEELDIKPETLICHVRNYFLFSFYCGGIRFGDIAKMKCSNVSDGRLTYTMSKTGRSKTVKLVNQAREVVAQYLSEDPERLLFPILRRYDISTPGKMLNAISAQNALVNKNLKQIGKQAGITVPISFHISRHSFADMARTRGWGVYDISKALGHSDLKTTERYLKGFDSQALDQKMDELFAVADATH